MKYFLSKYAKPFFYYGFAVLKDIFDFFIFVVHVLLAKRLSSSITKFRKTRTLPMFIMGNGPSLNEIKKDIKDRSQVNLTAVNLSILTDDFFYYKPEVYVAVDPTMINLNNENSYKCWSLLRDKVNWNILLVINSGYSEEIKKIVSCNPFLHLASAPFGSWTPSTSFFKPFAFKLMDLGINSAPRINVCISAITASIVLGYKDIRLYGVDHSWFNNLAVDDFNRVCLKDTHFYDNEEPVYKPFYRINGKIHTMVTLMEGYVELFTAYEVIRQYADYKSIKIINKTKGSFIDAFEKG